MKRKLFLLLCALLTSVGMWAYSTTDLTNAGWSQVTTTADLSTAVTAGNYFVFVDGQEGKYSMVNAMPKGILTHVARPMYQEIADPTSDFCQVWSIENYDAENYAIKNNSDDYYLNSNGAYWSSHVSGDYGETSRMKIISIGEGKYRLQTTGTSDFWGPYKDGGGSVDFEARDGMDFEDEYTEDLHYAAIAANKNEANAPGFYIYSIARTTFNAVCRRASTLDSEGWTKVTETEGLGKSGYYYVFLDASENGGESGFAMTGTGGRPQYKLGKNPIEDRTQLWTTEAHGSGYAIKNVEDGKYIYCAANWDMQATDNINTNNTDFIPAVTDGVWTLSNSISTGEFVGNYKNSPYNPTDGEELAANKASRKGKRTFLIYSIPTIAGVATELPGSGSMEADKWYYFTTTTAGDYGFSAVDGVILTANGDQAVSVATGDPLTQVKALNASTTYYIKSETAQTVTKSGPYTYTIGTAASDKVYVQPGNTVTVSYGSMATTNTYASEISTAITGVTLGGEPISVTRTTKGFTFTVPEVTKGANYTLSIPANIIGYDAPGSGKNEAQEITLKVPVATEGTYYLSTVIAGQRKWLNKNGSGYTYAYDQGLPFTLERNEGSVDTYKLKFSEGNYLNDVGSNWQTKIEGSKNDDWKLQAEDGGYKLLLGVNNDCQLFIANTSTGLIEITHSKDNGNIWEFVDPETALKYAIEKAEEHVLGFEAGEYAPYNNTAALAALATAKAATTTDARISAYAALTGATWTANAEEVDAICNGSFTGIARGTQDNVVPGWDGVFRKLITTEDYAALSASKEGRAMFSHDKTYVYGGQTGYTMPLKRNTKYALSFKAAGWENGNIATVSAVIKKPDGSTLKTLNITPTKRINEAESLVSGSIDFTVETSGNYTLEVTVPASTLAVITDFSVERLGIPVLMQVSGVAKMGTFCAPFDVVIPYGVKAYTLSDGTSDDWVHMDEVKGTTIAAGTPVLLTSDTKVEQEFVGQMTVLEPNNDGLLKGVFEKTEVAPDANNYILQYQDSKCAFYIVSDADIYIGKNRCYLHVAKTSARIAIDREEDGFTGINEVKSVEAEARTMKDGKYFVKGRIIVVKNGKVYGTNGQILN